MKLRRRSPDDPVRQSAERLHDALKNLFLEMCKALYIDRFVEWLSKKLK